MKECDRSKSVPCDKPRNTGVSPTPGRAATACEPPQAANAAPALAASCTSWMARTIRLPRWRPAPRRSSLTVPV
eukprot:503574-Pleurochrysis_carterae.AAC.1